MAADATEALFVYGTLRDAAVQQRLIGRTLAGTPERLTGYRRYDHLDYPVVLPQAGGVVDGLLLLITPAELSAFDAYEGTTYQRVRVTLAGGRSAWLYQGDPAVYGPLVAGI
ncbi:MAG: gamma-glutamylcyclotransferase [Anaerolineae bacterium]|nr:gamma-glutamylcyclotransferase [Anaerolineae bacterium]